MKHTLFPILEQSGRSEKFIPYAPPTPLQKKYNELNIITDYSINSYHAFGCPLTPGPTPYQQFKFSLAPIKPCTCVPLYPYLPPLSNSKHYVPRLALCKKRLEELKTTIAEMKDALPPIKQKLTMIQQKLKPLQDKLKEKPFQINPTLKVLPPIKK